MVSATCEDKIKDAERLLKYFPIDDRQSYLAGIATADDCLGNVNFALYRISKLTDPGERDLAIARLASGHAGPCGGRKVQAC
jgi:hypothetical protein